MTTTNILGDADIARIAHGLIDRSLPKSDWTHAAHFAAALWLVRAGREAEMPGLIRAYNTATGVANTDSSGYHETITQASLAVARAALAAAGDVPLGDVLAALMATRYGRSDWPFACWSRARLFTPAARAAWVEPDLARFDPAVR
ncbi:hypothetical protein EUV02_11635 [Polymorphobacter arshaanensis]|uniref:Uncharacterized protein n=1 Tax=Glacieibacterium arshaanense TaxID=2511025 RepID=A0A4Y9ENX3_9SPHN|nr:hypothetical protein [Polymorphobacter arshaanensis]TFU03785.1 hypothetical protein EUV02_11635 [Polymorphobacter arshaanensis]